MEPSALKDRSKFLSKVLRHQPDLLRLQPDEQGWVTVSDLLKNIQQYAPRYVLPFDRDILQEVVQTNDKQRFAFSTDGEKIRANQGHSIQVELGYASQEPPEILFHGTAFKNIEAILKSGINKGKRHHVHLSPDTVTAGRVGGRHGKPVILHIKALEMHRAGHAFYLSDNGVWLTDFIPAVFIDKDNLHAG